MWRDFKNFAVRGNVVDMAVGIIIGAAFTTIVTSLVNDILMPPIGLLLGGVDFSSFFLPLSKFDEVYATPDLAKAAGQVTINYGLFLNAVIRFVIVAFAVFLLVRQLARFNEKSPPPPPPGPSKSEELLTEIRDLLKK